MYKQETYDIVVRIIRDRLDVPEDWIRPDQDMGEGFELDSDDLTDMIDDMCRYFNIKDPIIHDWDKYQLSLIAYYGVSFWDLFRFWLSRFLKCKRQAHINYEGMTIAKLCEIIEAGQWPREYLLPPGYTDEPPEARVGRAEPDG